MTAGGVVGVNVGGIAAAERPFGAPEPSPRTGWLSVAAEEKSMLGEMRRMSLRQETMKGESKKGSLDSSS